VRDSGRVSGGLRQPFVGRESDLEELRRALGAALNGSGALVLIEGEPGIGKTRTAEELAAHASESGAAVFWGRCWEEEGAPVFWPWRQMVRAYARACNRETFCAELDHGAADIAHIVPEVGQLLPDLPPPPELEPAQARFRLFDSIATFLRNAAQRQPLLLVLDDLHWADQPSLLLLQFVARGLTESRLLVIGTYRHVELAPAHPLSAALSDLVRAGRCVRLDGLSREAVQRYVELSTGQPPSANLVTQLHQRTAGNPFFMQELLRLMVAEGRVEGVDDFGELLHSVPGGVRRTVRQRLSRLSPETQRVLALGSVIGRVFRLTVLDRLWKVDQSAVSPPLHDHLDEAIAGGILATAARNAGVYRFSHGLIRDTLYDDTATAARTALHHRIAEILDDLYAIGHEVGLAEIAHHYSQAGPDSQDRAVRFALRAAKEARSRLAFEEAVAHCRRALEGLDVRDERSARHRCGTLLLLCGVLADAGDQDATVMTSEVAAELARRYGLRRYLGRAAAVRARYLWVGGTNPGVIPLLEEGGRAIGTRDCALRARLLGGLSVALPWEKNPQRRLLSDEALTIARRIRDRKALAEALFSRHWALWEAENLDERLAIAREIVGVAEDSRNPAAAVLGRRLLITDLLELGDLPGVEREMALHARAADVMRNRYELWRALAYQAMRVVLAGGFAEGERLANQVLAQAHGVEEPAALQYVTAQLFAIRREQGRLDELRPAAEALAAQYTFNTGWRAAVAFMYSELDDREAAHRAFVQLGAPDLQELPRNYNWLLAVAFLSQVAAFLNDRRSAGVLYGLMQPYAQRIVVAPGIACIGSVAHNLGVLAATLEEWRTAATHFEDALTMNRRIGAPHFVAHTQREYAAMLLRRSEPGDAVRAHTLLDAAVNAYTQLGMDRFIERADALRLRQPTQAAGHGANLFLSDGHIWTIEYGGKLIRLRDSKGLRYLATLVAAPGARFHVRDLMGGSPAAPSPVSDTATVAAQGLSIRSSDRLDSGPDARARGEYGRRLAELAAHQDYDPAERQTDERRVLLGEVAHRAARGRHGDTSDTTEKMRKAVGNRIRGAMETFKKEHPALWQHFFASIRTGLFCSYEPERPTPWRLA